MAPAIAAITLGGAARILATIVTDALDSVLIGRLI